METNNTLHNKFKNFGAKPTEKVWIGIEESLNSKQKKKRTLWFWLLGGIASILFVFFTYKFYAKKELSVLKYTQTENNIEFKKHIKENTYNNKLSNVTDKKTSIKNVDNTLNTSQKTKSTLQLKQNISLNTPIYKHKKTKVFSTINKNKKSLNINKIKSKLALVPLNKTNEINNQKLSKPKKQSLIYSFQINSLFSVINDVITPSFNSTIYNLTADQSNNEKISSSFYYITRPLVIRFGVAKLLSKRFSLYSGVDIDVLHFSPKNNNQFLEIPKGQIYSLGIPLGLNFKILNKKRFEITSSFLFNNDFPLLKRSKTSSSKNNTFIKGYFGSVELNINNGFYIYENLKLNTQIGLRHYFYQSNIIETNKKLYFSAGLGVVFYPFKSF